MTGSVAPGPGDPSAGPVRQALTELDVAGWVARIVDPERMRPVVVVTSGTRGPGERLDPERIARAVGAGVDVVSLPTGSLTWVLERGLPADTHVFGDAARTYPVGTGWQRRPDLSPLRFARADSDARRLEAQVIADARAALRQAEAAAAPAPAPDRRRVPRQAPAGREAIGVTPAMLPGAPAPARRASPARSTPAGSSASAQPGAGSGARPAAGAEAGPAATPAGPTPATRPGPAATPARPTPATRAGPAAGPAATPAGPTPANPRGAPPRRPPEQTAGAGRSSSPTPATATAAGSPPRRAPEDAPRRTSGAPRPAAPARLSPAGLWHARSERAGTTLAGHLLAARRAHPVLVVSTPDDDAPPRVDAEDLYRRVGEMADVVVLHNGPASWAFAEAMPNMTQVYGGAGRVYPVDLRWTAKPSKAPLRFCWPADDPARVADQLEDDAYAAAHAAGLLIVASPTGALPATGRVKGPVGRHHMVLALDRGGDALMLVDALYPGVEPERLLAPGQRLSGRVRPGAMFPAFTPDPVADDPRRRVERAYHTGDVVLARITDVGARTATGLLHPGVVVEVRADDDEPDLRNLIADGDVATLTLLDPADGVLRAELADANAPSVACVPVLPGGPPWLVEADLPAPAPPAAEAPEPDTADDHDADVHDHAPAPPSTATRPAGEALSPATVGLHAKLAGLQAQVNDLANRLRSERAEAHRQAQAATRARDEAKRLRRQLRSLKDQHDAYRARQDGQALFADPEAQLRYDIDQAWLRRVPEPERAQWPLAGYRLGPEFLPSLAALEGITRDKVIDVLVEVLTDRAKDINGRDLHPLRTAEGAQDQRTRDDGARAWRCALQLNTPSARRLHFWRLPDGTIELDQVGTHDHGL